VKARPSLSVEKVRANPLCSSAQHEFRTRPNVISAYVDIKTVFESSDIDPTLPAQLEQLGIGLGEDHLRKVLLYRAFIRAIFNDIKQELKSQITSNVLESVLGAIGLKPKIDTRQREIFESLDKLLDNSFEAQITDITAFKQASYKAGQERSATNKSAGEGSAEGTLTWEAPKSQLQGSSQESRLASRMKPDPQNIPLC
jgi:hypothetical protein